MELGSGLSALPTTCLLQGTVVSPGPLMIQLEPGSPSLGRQVYETVPLALHPSQTPQPSSCPQLFTSQFQVSSRGLFDNIHFGPQFVLQRLLSCLWNLCMSAALPWSDQEVPEDRDSHLSLNAT